MCGLVGIMGKIGFKEEKVFKTLLMLDVIRGKHSTGVASLHKVGDKWETLVAKDKYNAIDFMDRPEFNTLMGKKHSILMGHNRWATRGAIVKENAHPFEYGNIIGAHNGSLISVSNLLDGTKFAVDSQALYYHLSEEDVDDLWGKLHGAAALTWIDKSDNSLHMLRNDDRPLYLSTCNKGETLVWASEPWMLHVACGREGVDMDKEPVEVQTDKHYKFTITDKGRISVKTKDVSPYVPPKWQASTYSYGNYSRYYESYDNAYSEGNEFLKKEGANEGDFVEFTVDGDGGIKDHMENGHNHVTVYGKTLKGTPIRLFRMKEEEYENLILEMWELPDTVFKGKISYAMSTGLVLSAPTVEQCYYTLQDLAAAKEESNELPHGIKFHQISYKIGCSYCRKLVSSYYSSPLANISCTECYDKGVMLKKIEENKQTLIH